MVLSLEGRMVDRMVAPKADQMEGQMEGQKMALSLEVQTAAPKADQMEGQMMALSLEVQMVAQEEL
jgi:hypothetical protein